MRGGGLSWLKRMDFKFKSLIFSINIAYKSYMGIYDLYKLLKIFFFLSGT